MEVNWDNVPDADSYEPLPDGIYEVCVENCVEALTKAGDTQFRLELVVTSPHAQGRKLFDSILFKDGPAMQRAKLVCHRLGFLTEGMQTIEPREFIGRECFVVVSGVREYEKDGKTYKQNVIPFDGYRSKEEDVL